MMEYTRQIQIIVSLWILSSSSFVFCGHVAARSLENRNRFNQEMLEQVVKAVYPLDISDFKYVIDGTVDKEILSADKMGTYGCLKPETSPPFQYMVRVYSKCELAVLNVSQVARSYSCSQKKKQDCEESIKSDVTITEQTTVDWKVGAKFTIDKLEISAEYGESKTTTKTSQTTVDRKMTVPPGKTATPYVISAGVRCFAEYHGVLKDIVGKLSSKGSNYEGITMACEKNKSCLFSCKEFKSDGSDAINNDFTRNKVPRECVYYKPTDSLYPVTRDPVVSCRIDKPAFFKGYMTMPLYNKNNNIVTVSYDYLI